MSVLTYRPMATYADVEDSPLKLAMVNASQTYRDATFVRASRSIERRCDRAFVPFVGRVQTERAEGVAADASPTGAGGPMSAAAAIGLARAAAYGGGTGMVRDFWLDEHAAVETELWTYSGVSVSITPPFGGGAVTVGAGGVGAIEGPAADSGHIRLPIGTYCPVGSTVVFTYGGGYTVRIPDDLVQATILQAAKSFILFTSPERRANLSVSDLDGEIDRLLIPFVRGG